MLQRRLLHSLAGVRCPSRCYTAHADHKIDVQYAIHEEVDSTVPTLFTSHVRAKKLPCIITTQDIGYCSGGRNAKIIT